MKKRIVIWISCFALILPGCTLFPLKNDEQPFIRSEQHDTTDELVIIVTEAPRQLEEEEADEQAIEPSGETVKPAEIEESEEAAQDLVYCISPVNVRAAGESVAPTIGSLRTGDAVTKVSQEGGWIEIIFEGRPGYVYMDYLSETAPN